MKRSKRFCFETKSDSAASRGRSDGERESDYDQIKETSNYEFESVPKGNVPNARRYLTLDTSTNGTATTAHVTTYEDDYNVLSHNSPPHSPVKSNADAYSHINVKKKGQKRCDVTDGDYDTAGLNVMSACDPTYSHINGEVEGDYSTAGGDSRVEPVASDDYSHIGEGYV
ncbi:uncharacterized protein LOC121385685 [Gigantopelta aegis]|uniref:uncharacterized protein LOC121385685 n=1 Tax=Gigantopelta aegis TaxID=1735272 RepID=UPI001B88B633|nr:uncharacterized protein LOC121385685 [Gigantopelta aegis]